MSEEKVAKITPDQWRIGGLSWIASEIARGVTPEMLDDLTFTVLPSYFDLFTTRQGCGRFRVFLRETADFEVKWRLSRMLFFSSSFLRFVQRVLRTVVRSGDAGRLRGRWRKHASLCPGLVSEVLADEGPRGALLLSRGFFEIVFSRGLSEFGLCEFSETPSREVLEGLRVSLTAGPGSRLPELVSELSVLLESKALLDAADEADCPELFQRVLLSRLDDQVLSALVVRGKLTWVGTEYHHRLAYRLPTGIAEALTELLDPDMTRQGDEGGTHLRHLLQLCDPIAKTSLAIEGRSPEEQQRSFRDAVFEMLVERGPRETRMKRAFLFKRMALTDDRVTPHNLSRWARNVVLDRTASIRAVSTFERIDQRSQALSHETFEARELLERAFLASQVRRVWPKLVIPETFGEWIRGGRKATSYYDDPRRFREAMEFASRRLALEVPLTSEMKSDSRARILFGFLTRDFRFSEYVARRRGELGANEGQLQGALGQRTASEWAEQIFPAGAKGRDRLLHAEMAAVARDEAFLGRVRKAFAQERPWRMIARASCVFVMLTQRLRDRAAEAGMRPSEIGAEETVPACCGLIVLARPATLLANYAFISDFYRGQAERFDDFFQGECVDFTAWVTGAIERLVERNPDSLLPPGEARIWSGSR